MNFYKWLCSRENRGIVVGVSALDSCAALVYHFDRGFTVEVTEVKVVIKDGDGNKVVVPLAATAKPFSIVDGWSVIVGQTELQFVAV